MAFSITEFNRFFQEYQQRFVYFAKLYIHDEVAAEDLVIESMMYYWEHRHDLPADTNVPAYVLTAIKHRCIDYLRHLQMRQHVTDELSRVYAWELSSNIRTLENFEPYEVFTQEIQEIVTRTLRKLSEQTRQVFVMSRYEHKSHREIAASLGITQKGVEFHIAKAIRELKKALADYFPLLFLFLLF